MSEIIYGLSHIENNEKVYFYIGHTNRPPEKRMNEHRYLTGKPNTVAGQYLRYDYTRALDALGILWNMDVLSSVPEGIYLGDYEFEYIIKYLIAGHPLQNQKHGDKLNIAGDEELKSMISSGVRTALDVKKFREKKEAETLANKLARQLKQAAKVKTAADKIEAYKAYVDELTEKQRIREEERIERDRLINIRNNIILTKRVQDEKIRQEKEIIREAELKKLRVIQENAWLAEEKKNAQLMESLRRQQMQIQAIPKIVEVVPVVPVIPELAWDDVFKEEPLEAIEVIAAKKSNPSTWLLSKVEKI